MKETTTSPVAEATDERTEELLDDYPSEYITGTDNEAPAFAYELTDRDFGFIFDDLCEQADADPRGDRDGEHYEVDYKVFRIEAEHHYRTHLEQGGDSYCGVWEMVPVIDEDYFEVRRVFDEEGRDYPGYVAKLNEYARKHN